MNKIIFSSWAGKVIDNRGLDTEEYTAAEGLELPLEYNGHRVRAFMSWNGLVVTDDRVNIVDMAYSYLKEVQKLSCGECTVGYSGIRVMLDTLTRISNGEGNEADIDLMQWLGEGIKENAKCDFCASAVTPVLDTINYYKEEYLKLITSRQATPKSTYITRVTAPCMEACPAYQDIPGYIELIRNYRFQDALRLIRETNCLPGVMGRACVASCEAACTRANIDSPVSIRALKRSAADYEITSGLEPVFEKVENSGQKVAVIGAGPAGLAASYNLALKGYKVTIYDELPSAGGMATVGIPPYRLPRDVINREVEIIRELGVEFKLNTKIGKDVTLDDLFNEGFKAIFIATGAHRSRELGIEAEDEAKVGDIVIHTKRKEAEIKDEGLVDGVRFLHNVNMGKKIEPKDRVIIIGGGNVAIDCARTCLRLGFKDVTIVYRRSRSEMPGRREEVEEAEKEGAKITFLTIPVKILTEGGRVIGAKCIRAELGEPDASGRRRPIPIKGSEFIMEADMIISAIGEEPDLSFLTKDDRIQITSDGTIKVEPSNCQTSQAGVFSGGDCVTGPATLVEAIAAGNQAARSIDQYLRLGKIVAPDEDVIESLIRDVNLVGQTREAIVKSQCQPPEQLSLSDRVLNFDEVERCFTAESALKEAERCLRCYRVMLLAI